MICGGQGYWLKQTEKYPKKQPYLHDNLCLSTKKMKVHDIETNKKCEVLKVETTKKMVIVGCDMVENCCLPVHFEKYEGKEKQDTEGGPCAPRTVK